MSVLIIDDEWETRSTILADWWKTKYQVEESDITALKEYPKNQSLCAYLLEHPEFTMMSLDHDLGNTEVGQMLTKEDWHEPELFRQAFADKIVILHSANPVGSSNMYNTLRHIAKLVLVIPITTMAGVS